MIDPTAMRDATLIEQHYRTAWSLERVSSHRWNRGPTAALPPEFYVVIGARSRSMLAYATIGMSVPSDAERLELHLLTPVRAEPQLELVELLTVVAHYHRTGARLGVGHTVNFGQPWLPGSRCTHGLVSLPYVDGPALEWLDVPPVQCLWLLPITTTELDFKKRHGLDALEQRFEAAGLDALDPTRASVV